MAAVSFRNLDDTVGGTSGPGWDLRRPHSRFAVEAQAGIGCEPKEVLPDRSD
jgi:hypothetical protein